MLLPRPLGTFLDKFSRRLPGGYSFAWPRIAGVEHTTRCNLNCKTCARHFWGGEFHDMDDEVARRVVEEVVPHLDGVVLSGYGEPLLGKHFDPLFEKCRALGKHVALITNGVLLTPERMKQLVEAGCCVHLSIDGNTNETLTELRGVKFDLLMDRIERFMALRREKPDTGFRLEVIFVLLRRNAGELVPLMRRLDGMGVDAMVVQHPVFDRRDDEMSREALRHHPETAAQVKAALDRAVPELKMRVVLPSFEGMAPRTESTGNAVCGPPPKCWLPWFEVYIDVKGNVKACCYGGAPALGSLRTQSFGEIWNGKPFRRLRETVNSRRPPSYCLKCGLIQGRNQGAEGTDDLSPSHSTS